MEKYTQDFCTAMRDNIRCILTGKYEEGSTDLNTLGNYALMRIARVLAKPFLRDVPRLTGRKKRAVRQFYRPYVRRIPERYHRIYTGKSGGRFCPEYIPEDLFFMDVDRYYSDREEARYLDNKCYYYRLFPQIRQPGLVAMRIGRSWLDGSMRLAAPREVLGLLRQEPEVVVKRAVNSQGGFGVDFLGGAGLVPDFRRLIRTIPCDVVIQRPVRQHPQMAELHEGSVNTLRIVSLLSGNQVKVYATVVRIGTGGARVDNGSSGGIICGVQEDGSLGSFGTFCNGEVIRRHPDKGYLFSQKKVPNLERAYGLVREAHAILGHFRLVAWDVAIDRDGEAVLIEANLSLGGIKEIQVCTGPLFGEDTEKILGEVYRGRRRKWTTWM